MIDIRLLRENPDLIRENCRRRGSSVDLEALIRDDQSYLGLVREVEELRAERNRLSKDCRDNPAARERVRDLKSILAGKEDLLEQTRSRVEAGLSWLPNLLADDVPPGASDQDNRMIRESGVKPSFAFAARDHQALGEILGIIDTTRGAKVAQSGFYYWTGRGAELTNALFFWAQRELIARGFTGFITPCVAKAKTLYGTGYLPFFADQTYRLEGEDLSLIGTSEQTMVGYHADEVLDAASLPRCYCAFTPCFRTEAGSYGKEVRGIFRVHQFHKDRKSVV